MNEIGLSIRDYGQNIRRMNDMLKTAMGAELEFGEKMLKTEVTAQVQDGLGENLDVSG